MKDDDNHILLLEKGKRGLLQIIFGRTGIIIVSLIVQILFLFDAFYKLEGYLPYFWGGNTLLSAAVFCRRTNSRPLPAKPDRSSRSAMISSISILMKSTASRKRLTTLRP